MSSRDRETLRLVQLPVPPPAALAATGNVPLAAGCLGVAAQIHGLDHKLHLEVVPPALTDRLGDTLLADQLAQGEPAFVGFSLYLWNIERSLHLAREVKRRSPRTKILVGGPEVSSDNPFLLGQDGFDVAVTGEAEDSFAALMERLLDTGDASGMPGAAVRTASGVTPFGPAATTNFPLTRYPSPYLSGLVAVEPERDNYVETVRGCRSHCTFCFYPRSSSNLRSLDPSQSGQLLSQIRERGAHQVSFLDPTFNHRPDFEGLLEALALANPGRTMSFFGEVRAEGLTAAHAKALKRAGFDRLEIGLQSVNRDTLKRVKRGGSPELVAKAAKLLSDEGITPVVDLIIGLPGDTPDDVARGVDYLQSNGLAESAQVFALALLPGTAMRASADHDGIAFEPSPPYRVKRTATFSEGQLVASLAAAEEQLERRLDEWPRPHLSAPGDGPLDVFTADLDRETPRGFDRPGARHVALWFHGSDLFGDRANILAAIEQRQKVDPFATIDVVLSPRRAFPLDLIAAVRAKLDAAPASYLSRVLALRPENAMRRLSVVLPRGTSFDGDWIDALDAEAPVFREVSAAEATPGTVRSRIIGDANLDALFAAFEPDELCFENRELERAWLKRALHG